MAVKRDRIGMFDVLKGFLLLTVVLIHHYSFVNGGMRPFIPDAPGARLSGWTALCMGLFFVIAGYQYRASKNRKEYIGKQFRQLILPYFAAVALCAFLRFTIHYLCTGEVRVQEISTLAMGGLYGVIQNTEIFGIWAYTVGTFWFLPTFFFSGVFFQLIQKIRNKKAAALCIWGLTVGAVYLPDAWHFQFPWFLVQSCAVLGFMETGRLLKERRVLYGKLPVWFVAIAALLYVGCHIFSESNIASNIWGAGILDYGAACGMSVVVLRIYLKTEAGEKKLFAVLEYIGMYSMLFFLVHGLGFLLIPWEAPLGERIMQLGIFAHRPVWLAGTVTYLIRCVGITLGCYALDRMMKLKYKLIHKKD